MIHRSVLLAPIALIASCATTQEQFAEGPAKLGQTVFVDGPVVRPDKVIEDSRCPSDVQCVWAGRVRILATVITGPGPQQMELELGKPVHVADGMLTLSQVTPSTHSERRIEPGDYRFTFTFAGGY